MREFVTSGQNIGFVHDHKRTIAGLDDLANFPGAQGVANAHAFGQGLALGHEAHAGEAHGSHDPQRSAGTGLDADNHRDGFDQAGAFQGIETTVQPEEQPALSGRRQDGGGGAAQLLVDLVGGGGVAVHRGTGGGGGHSGGGGSAGDGKAYAIAVIVVAATALVVAAAVEGSRFDGYANIHPMMPVHLFGRDGGYTVLPLAWIDPQTASWADHAIVRENEGPWQPLERAPLDRAGLTYAMFGGIGSYKSADGSVENGTATTIQLGVFPEQHVGVVGSIFFGWRDNAVNETLFESRYTLELQGYPIVAGPLHAGLYGGGGAAYRWEDGIPGGNSGSMALIGGAMFQLDFNTRLALTARLGQTYAHSERMSDLMIGLAVY